MATSWQTYPVKFEKGLIDNLGRLEQGTNAPGSATTLQNFENSVEGGYAKILGYAKFSSTEVTGAGQIAGVVSVNTNTVLTARAGKYYIGTGTTWTEKATAANTGFSRFRSDRFNFSGQEKIVVVDGLNDPGYYNVATASMSYDTSAPTDVTGASFVRMFKNHLFFAKGNLLTFTAPYDETDYNTGNGAGVINVGADITGLTVFREQLIIFSIDRIQRLVGNTLSDFVLQPIASNTGCLNGDTVQEIGGDILYLGPDGIRFLSATQKNDDFALDLASRKISEVFTNFIKRTSIYSSLVIRGKNQYRVFGYSPSLTRKVSEGFAGTIFSDQSVDDIGWSKLSGIKVYAADSRQYGNIERIIFCSDTGYIYSMEVGNSFDGMEIPAIFETPFFPFDDPRVRKTIYKHTLYVSVKGDFNFQVSVKLDYRAVGVIQPPAFRLSSEGVTAAVYGSPTSVYGTSLYGDAAQNLYTNLVEGSGFTFALRYEDVSVNPSFNLDYAILEYTPNERR